MRRDWSDETPGETHYSRHRGSWPRRTPDPAWFDDVVVGSVLREGPSGPFRIVRAVTRRQCDNRLWCVVFTIRRRSWTNRPATYVLASDLKCRGYTMVPNVRVKPKTLLDVRIAQSIAWDGPDPPSVRVEEVIGIA